MQKNCAYCCPCPPYRPVAKILQELHANIILTKNSQHSSATRFEPLNNGQTNSIISAEAPFYPCVVGVVQEAVVAYFLLRGRSFLEQAFQRGSRTRVSGVDICGDSMILLRAIHYETESLGGCSLEFRTTSHLSAPLIAYSIIKPRP